MGRAAAARKLAAAAAYGGGGLGAVGAGLYGLLRFEATLARRTIGEPREDPPPVSTGWYGRSRPGPAVRIALLGDSLAAGYGVERAQQTPGALLAAAVAAHADRRVYLRNVAVVGAKSSDLPPQVDLALPVEPDVAVIIVGGNDVTHTMKPSESVQHLAEAVRRLRSIGCEVVVATCPDLGTLKPIPPPLKQIARSWSRRLAAGQTIAAVEEDGRTVSLGSVLGPEFASAPALLFGPDQFHPSASGYEQMAAVIVPSVLAAVGEVPESERLPAAFRGERVLPIAQAAIEAVRTPGTELGGTEVAGNRRGVRGRWVELRHRRRREETDRSGPEGEDDDETVAEGATTG
ncbi:SGNH/GDSL hydrolase family protein [Nocardioides zeae]|uniref:SGNH/GDSL hydrolase family protein n=1 Tax=Nocardioides imazamoxiresistens TaxID=3231893 RepID=A0ABU3PZN6_9ACTN|nr:SGNH/GDSL hydrolase family protein [Nocardioides zeae]MDT9594336.1 SGNH/GDSL hydrolase family protein [Nocardioides zeae]